MKRLSLSFLFIFSLAVVLFSACKEENNPQPAEVTISSVSPASGMVGDTVTIAGSNFSTTAAQNTVQIGSANATVISAAASQLQVTIPQLAAGSYDVKVTVDGKSATASAQFEVTETAPTEVVITDADLAADTYNWTKDKSYLVDGLVYLEAGGALNIEAGTTIRFKATPSDASNNTSALFITKGAQIMAEGTAEAPIIFTAEADTAGAALDPIADNAQWGGLIILGNAPASRQGVTENIQIEGIATSEARGAYGGNDPADNSGVIKYVSIRYTGVGLAPGDELQGLTLGGVGSGTTISYVDVFSSADDGVEIFGGTVNLDHFSVAFTTDDDFDFDLGYRGNAQFLFSIASGIAAESYDNSGEWDGADPDDAALFSAPNIYNATFVGPGQDATGTQRAILMRDAFAGKFGNSILADFPGKAVQVEDRQGTETDAYGRLTTAVDGYQLAILNNTFSQFNGYTVLDSLVEPTTGEDQGFVGDTTQVVATLKANDNVVTTDAVLTGISRNPDGGLDPRPAAATEATATVPEGLEQVDYRGAFEPGQVLWLSGWSTLAKLGYLAE